MPNAFITGTSSGLGRALAERLLQQGWAVYGVSRRGCDLPGICDTTCDLTDTNAVPAALDALLAGVERLDLVVLNAGVVGQIRLLAETPLPDAKQVMDVNLWANKTVMDRLHARGRPVDQLVMISSGAAVLGNKGWGAYALSKAALNMLAKLYAHELPHTHITALAPGIIDTAMMDYLCDEADADAFPALKRLQDARGSERMPDPATAAARVLDVLPRLRERPSGSFVDIREILEPEAYAQLYAGR
ncbi:SDR family NAD(P)-dependent oxidoreductase [uncultured Thiohalocapsa sp.]|uniref:SDR family NAD(P)-dependent oxidoreductase n=1 Tax=uncultured Thiohalocapsa sp. TaxID=768990 RepID=UPI0025F4F5BD|nr:SDR family NAD(P)-dependent oxidoreductase [uncultured Thiohalocapsa sp.]